MTELTAETLASELTSGCEEYTAQLKLVTDAEWERKPAPGGEGEDAWSARQVAEHVQGACGFFGNAAAKVAGFDGPGRTYSELPTVAAAIDGLPAAFGALQAVVTKLSAENLAAEVDAPWGKTTLGGLLGGSAAHFKDHANQLKALRG